jgi:Family of unknown function (DUF5343)
MATKYPYVSSAGPLMKTIDHLRKRSFPPEVTADTLRALGVAPKNESYVINTLRFLAVIDGKGKKVDANAVAFDQHKEEEFQKAFEKLVRDAYDKLFELHGDDAWSMSRADLTQFFRTTDHSSELVGTRQAGTFTCLAGLAGHAKLPQQREAVQRKPAVRKAKAAAKPPEEAKLAGGKDPGDPRVGLTVRIEVNLPADGDQQTYDRIFKSIRKNLIDRE